MNRSVRTLLRAGVLGGWFLGMAAAAHAAPPTPEPDFKDTFLLHQIRFAGNAVFTDGELLQQISLSTGTQTTSEQIAFSQKLIESVYRKHGYWEVSVSTQLAQGSGRRGAVVAFIIFEGDPYTVGQVHITGNRLLSNRVVRRELQVHPGDPFSQTAIFDGHRRLFSSGYFETIDITYSTSTSNSVDVNVAVQERATQYLSGSAGYGIETKERLSLGWAHRNFLGNLRRLEAKATHSGFVTDPSKFRTTLLEVSMTQPYFLNSTYQAKTAVSREWKDRESFDSVTSAWRSSIGKAFGPDISAEMRYRFEGTRIRRINPDLAAETPSFTNISAVGPQFTYDNTDDPFLPRYGWRVNSGYEKGLSLIIGDLDFHRWEAKAGRYETFFDKLTMLLAVQGGVERPDDPSDTIPVFERFLLGGGNSVRGYSEDDLGPVDSQGDPLGGEAYLAATLEFRHPIWKRLSGVVFLDGGQLWSRAPGKAWPTIKMDRLESPRYGAGGGFRLNTPIGGIRLEAGYKLNPEPRFSGFWDRFTIHFGLGEPF